MFLRNPQILIVDDERSILVALRAILEPQTPHIFEAMDGLESIKKIKNQHFDIIFSNLRMPRIDGLELLELLPELGCQAKMIIVSGMLCKQEHILELKKAGAFDALPKPLDKDKIIQTLHNALGAIYREALLMPN